MDKTKEIVKQYIDELCIHFNPYHPDDFSLFIKASMEFSLLCYVYHVKSNLPVEYLQTCKTISEKIDHELFKLNKTFGFKYIFDFLGVPNSITLNESKDIRDYFAGDSLLMEAGFILDVFKQDLSKGYWELAAFEIYKHIKNEGLSVENCYQITHLVMFGTHMGQRELTRDCSERTVKICEVILSEIEKYAKETEYWDLLLEVYICMMYLNSFNDSALNLTLPKYGSYYLSKGSSDEKYKKNIENPLDRMTYQLFHTTLVKCLLDVELEHSQVRHLD